ncbi:LytR/AlgR family response regulator transcription factor [Christensenella tenuis]|jgi:DNA-binding LytR/AlgR family response regulator|uniref:Stage 0 sporulation protein A homolog n=1 Tax=Christensenella tenuis TaxID=2763033 RepID=A0ABR7EFT6_9FIRM|nr:LytTR family DNA-binding domain-containing protein [Christensenella tenuis]MBC5647989.1 response regulator transcription factor [Christensenella tenuis]
MYYVNIGDDDPLFLEQITQEVTKILSDDHLVEGRDFKVASFSEPGPLYDALLTSQGIHQLLLLDIEFGGQNGMELAKRLRENDVDCSLVYITAFRDYVYDCFGTRPLWYLVKPVDWEKLAEIIRGDYRETYKKNYFNIKIGGRQVAFPYQDIYALEAVSHRVRIWLGNGASRDWNGSLSKLGEELPGWCFCRCHNSFVINLAHVTELMRSEAIMDNGAVYPVSRKYYIPTLNQYFAFLKK